MHECHESPDPRNAGWCACGKRLSKPEPTIRTAQYEHQYLVEAAECAERRFGISTGGFVVAVERRLALGQELYGNSFLTRDLPKEMLEEAWDVPAYALLETQKRFRGDEDDAAMWHLFEAGVHAAAIDYHARMVKISG